MSAITETADQPGDTGQHPPLLAATGVEVRYGQALALSDLSLTVEAGSALAVIGPNGAGKSTLARALSGLVPTTKGTISWDGDSIKHWPAHKIRRAGLLHLPEGRGVLPNLSVGENLRMAAGLVPRSRRKNSVERGYEIFPALASRRRQTAGTLSGGEQQMLSLARALIIEPRLVIADEMSLGLAPKMVDLVFEGLGRARDNGVAIIIIEQFIHRALAFADRCVVLSRGSVAWSGPSSEAKGEVINSLLGNVS